MWPRFWGSLCNAHLPWHANARELPICNGQIGNLSYTPLPLQFGIILNAWKTQKRITASTCKTRRKCWTLLMKILATSVIAPLVIARITGCFMPQARCCFQRGNPSANTARSCRFSPVLYQDRRVRQKVERRLQTCHGKSAHRRLCVVRIFGKRRRC